MDQGARRPLKTRETRWAHAVARALTRSGIAPNTISAASILFGAGAGLSFLAAGRSSSPWLFVVAAACIQLRLACNLFDGMVAVEGGRKSKSGEVYNDLPDRISDLLTIVPVGTTLGWRVAAGVAGGFAGITLGWIAGVLAILTAYVRLLGGASGLPQDFSGPMAKQQRMALLTGASILAAIERWLAMPPRVMAIALLVMILGTAATAVRRALRIVRGLEAR